jgi:hypothetical protein
MEFELKEEEEVENRGGSVIDAAIFVFITHIGAFIDLLTQNADMMEAVLDEGNSFLSTKRRWRIRFRRWRRQATTVMWLLSLLSTLIFGLAMLGMAALWKYVTSPRPI